MSTGLPPQPDGPPRRIAGAQEERLRLRGQTLLREAYGYAEGVMARGEGGEVVVYASVAACRARDAGRARLVVVCGARDREEARAQLGAAIAGTSAGGGAWLRGAEEADEEVAIFRRVEGDALVEWVGLPRPGESWERLGRRAKAELVRPQDLKGLLRRCHNRLHARGAAGDEEDLTLDVVRILVTKALDERGEGELPQFYCTAEEYPTPAGRRAAAARVRALFERAKSLYPGVFRGDERITVGDRAICDVVGELQAFRLLSEDASSDEWDVMGLAYEEYTAVALKRKRGQFFTNRLVVDLLVGLVDPDDTDRVLDPAGGSAGFLSGALRHVRRKVSAAKGREAARRRIQAFQRRLFMVEISRRLVKVAKTAMILSGDGHTGMTQGDALGPLDQLDPALLEACGPGTPTVILTNPPFAGVGDGRITDARVLERFECGRRWATRDGVYGPTAELLAEGAPPELLFFERCVRWLAPGGRLGIVLPKSVLDTATFRPARALLVRECRLLAVITCHKNTFQPHTGVRTAILVVERRRQGEASADPPVFMAISRAVGQDSEGAPVYARDATGALTGALDEDLSQIAAAWNDHRRGALAASEYRFAVAPSALDDNLNINPQAYRPSLNATIEAIEALDDAAGWSVSQLGELAGGVEVFKGPRLKSENLLVDEERAGEPGVEPYYTPSAVLQERRDAAKRLDTSRASASQAATIAAIRVRRGDLVITRSGTIGRVAMITALFDGAIVSDDLIRVRVADEATRLYLWAYLESRAAQDQIMRNEYGAIQQHLEPAHVRSLLVPVPTEEGPFTAIVDARRRMLAAKEALLEAQGGSDAGVAGLLGFLTADPS
ncbi:MAG: N-6 DNA methylase [Nannocystaceae bacterium]